MAAQDNDYVPISVNNQPKLMVVPFGAGCEVESGTLSTEAVLVDALPATPEGYQPKRRDCGPSDETEAVYVYPPGESEVPTGDGFDTSYSYSKGGSDFAGNGFVSAPAPILTAVAQNKPRPTGNWYAFTPQSALNVVLPKRFPVVAIHSKKRIGYPGSIYTNWDAPEDVIGRGYTHVTESSKPSNPDSYPTTLPRLIEGSFYSLALDAANSLPSGDSRKQQLLDWAGPFTNNQLEGPHILITDEAAARYYGRQWWLLFKDNLGWRGAGVDGFSVNMEHMVMREGTGFTHHQQQLRMVGWITAGCIDAAAQDGKTLVSGLSAEFGNLTTYAPWFHDSPATTDRNGNAWPEPNANIPQYMHYRMLDESIQGSSQSAPLGDSTIIGQLVKAGKAYIGVGRYLQHTIDEQTYWQKNSGSMVLDGNGNPLFRDEADRTATITGQSCTIYSGDYFMAMIKLYGIFAQFCSNMWFMAGSKHLPLSTDRQTGWEAMKGQVTQFRLDVEGESGINRPDGAALNQRPLAPDMVEGYAIAMYQFCDYIRGWMQSQMPAALGADTGYGSKARAAAEIYAKGFQRGANLNWIHDTAWQLIQPKFWIWKQGINGAADPDEHFARKPLIMGGLATRNGKPTIWLFAWWPCQDVDRQTQVKVWINKGSGALTGSYLVIMDGRRPYLDYWTLPDEVAGLVPKDVYFQFQSLTGGTLTWRGDYREAKITLHPTPPPVI